MKNLPSVVFIGHLPPPVMGMCMTTQALGEALRPSCHMRSVSVSAVRTEPKIAYHLSRMMKLLKSIYAIIETAFSSQSPEKICVIGCDGGFGMAYVATQLLFARIFGYRSYLHHHSYSYIDHHSNLMRAILAVGGPELIHVFLAEEMAQSFVDQYCRKAKGFVVSNAAHWPSHESRVRSAARRPFTLGLLSNLDASKGLFTFLALYRAARAGGIDIKAVLAGPLRNAGDRPAVQAAVGESQGRLEWRGPVYGAEKEAFFNDIDLFVFPTTYVNEAQPNVIIEAMSRGIPVIAYHRGTIASQVLDAGVVVPRDADFVGPGIEFLKSLIKDPNRYDEFSHLARLRFEEQKAQSIDNLANFIRLTPETFEPVLSCESAKR